MYLSEGTPFPDPAWKFEKKDALSRLWFLLESMQCYSKFCGLGLSHWMLHWIPWDFCYINGSYIFGRWIFLFAGGRSFVFIFCNLEFLFIGREGWMTRGALLTHDSTTEEDSSSWTGECFIAQTQSLLMEKCSTPTSLFHHKTQELICIDIPSIGRKELQKIYFLHNNNG
jgi:hypothetical protein